MADSLRAHGFLEVEINPTLTNICEVLPRACEIPRLGPEKVIAGETWRFLDRSLTTEGRLVGWFLDELYREGTYGKIYKAFRMVIQRREDGLYDVVEEPSDVIVKRTEPPEGSDVLPAEDVNAHTSEALLHVLAWRALQDTAAPWAIPRPFEVYGDHDASGWRSMSLCMSYVRGRTLHSYCEKYWKRGPFERVKNTRDFLEILAQVAYILHHLQVRLNLNHRDVKVNNILIRRRSAPVILELEGKMLASQFEVTLIDFGFACVGCPPPKAPVTVFQAGSWFPMGELCCKVGRDIAQLLYCIHCYFPMRDYLTAGVYSTVRSWMRIPWSGGVADGLHGFTKEGRPRRLGATGAPKYNTGIYEFLRRPDVDPVSCGPLSVFKQCCVMISGLA
jgi:serine/threonine protein kinase